MTIDFRLVAVGLVVTGGVLMSAFVTSLFEPGAATGQSQRIAPLPQAVAPVAPTPSAMRKEASTATTAARTAASALPPAEGKAGAPATPASRFTHFRVGERNVKRILVDGERIWVGTSGGVVRYNPKTDEFKLFDVRTGLKANGIVHVGKLQGRIAVGTLGGGLAVLDGQTDQWETFGPAEGLPDAVVNDVLQASNGDVWIATRSGVARIRGGALRERGNWSQFAAAGNDQGLPSNRVYALAEGRNGDIWAATEAGVALYRNGGWRHWNRPAHGASEGSAAPQRVGVDGSTASPAANAAAAPKAGAHGGESASGANFIVAVAVDSAGIVWAGTLGGGLLRYDGTTWKRYTLADGLPGDHIFALHQDAGNLLWVGTNNGLARMKDGRFTVMTKQDGLYANAVFAMASSPDTLWVGSYGGVARIRTVN